MSTECHIMAIGKYREEVREYLDYPAEWYENCVEGESIVWSSLLFYRTTKRGAEDLADSLNIGLYAPGTWWIPNDKMRIYTQGHHFRLLPSWDDEKEALLALLDAGFDFMFMLEA